MIRFACTCGKKLQARDELSGRRMKCPQCQRVLSIPEPRVEISPSPVPLAELPEKGPGEPITPSAFELHFEVTEVLEEERVILEPEVARMPPPTKPASVHAAAPARPMAPPPAGIFLTQTATWWRGDDQKLLDPRSARADRRDRSRWAIKLIAAVVVAVVVLAAVILGHGLANRLGLATPATLADLVCVPSDDFRVRTY